MNERIRLLAEQARKYAFEKVENSQDPTEWSTKYYNEMFDEKFAELIVRECADFMYKNYPNSRYEVNYMRKHMGDPDWNKPIEKHFGVEE
jgi:hypothetical protein